MVAVTTPAKCPVGVVEAARKYHGGAPSERVISGSLMNIPRLGRPVAR